MAQIQRVEGQVELKCHANKFFDIWACKTHQIPNIIPNQISKIELHDGEWDKAGALLKWSYVLNDSKLSIRTKVEELDVKNKKMKYSYPDGFIAKNIKSHMHAIPKEDGSGCIVKWAFEYEKMNNVEGDLPEAKIYIDYLLDLAKGIDAQLCSHS
ncbi:unnamed protein product [Amaranthus hypochondriacus]